MPASSSSPSIVCRRIRSRWRSSSGPGQSRMWRIDRELADVVQHRHELDLGRVERVEAQVLGHHARVRREAVTVLRGRRVMQAQLEGERLDRLRHPWSVGQHRRRPCHGPLKDDSSRDA